MLDLFLYMAGGFDKIKSTVSNQFWKIEGIEDNVFTILENTSNGIVASLHSTMTQWRHLFSLEIFLERGYMTLNGLKTSSGAYGEEVLTIANNIPELGSHSDEKVFKYLVDDSWNSEISMFFECIRTNEKIPIGNSSDAESIMKIIGDIYKKDNQ